MSEQEKQKTDVIIIGAGPVGLFAVFELGLLDMKTHLVDILDKPGGQCAELYPEKPIYDIPGFPVVVAQELIDRLMEQIKPFAPVFHFGQMAEKLQKLDNGHWQLTTDRGTIIEAPALVIAAGGGSFVPKRLPMKDIKPYEGRSVFYAVRKKEQFRDQKIIIAGGGDSALDWAIALQPVAERILLVHRRDDFRAAPDSIHKMRALVSEGKMDFQISQISKLHGAEGQLQSVSLKPKEGDMFDVECDALLAFYGLTMKLGPIADFGLNMDRNLIPVDVECYESSISGIFAIGDINSYPAKKKLILSGFHEAALMAHAVYSHVYEGKIPRFQYTTSSSAIHEKLGVGD